MRHRKLYPGGTTAEMRFMEAPVEVVEARGEGEKPRVRIAISSESLVERTMYGMSWREILDHSPGSVQMSRMKSGAAPFLLNHDSQEMLGALSGAAVEPDRVLRADVDPWGDSPLAEQVYRDIAVTKIRKSVSVGYIAKRWKLVEEDAELGDLWRCTLWEPCEASSVPIPADTTVGVGRSGVAGAHPVETEEEDRQMKKWVLDERGMLVEVDETDSRKEATPVEIAAAQRKAADGGVKRDRNAELVEIRGFCRANGVDLNDEWLARDLTPGEYGLMLLKERATLGKSQGAAETLDMKASDLAKYRYSRAMAIGAGLNPKGDDGFGIKPSGIEWEMHRELEKKVPVSFERKGGILVPMDLGLSRRTLDSLTATKGAETVFETPGEMIDMLRNRTALLRMGARQLTGLSGPVAFPKQTGGMTFYWVGENPGVDVANSDIAFGLVTLSPKTLMGATKYSRQLLVQAPSSGIAIENMVRDEFAIGHGLAIDLAGFHSDGSAGKPLGLFNTPDVLAGGSAGALSSPPTWKELVKFISAIAGVNAPTDNLGWVTTPEFAGMLMYTLRNAAAAGGAYLWDGKITDGQVAGYRATATNQILKTLGTGAQHGIAAGAWEQCIIGGWAGVELVVDPYTYKKQALIEVASFEMADIIFRYPQAFCVGWATID